MTKSRTDTSTSTTMEAPAASGAFFMGGQQIWRVLGGVAEAVDLDTWNGLRAGHGRRFTTPAPPDAERLAAVVEIAARVAPRCPLYLGGRLEHYGSHWPFIIRTRPDGTRWGQELHAWGPIGGLCAADRSEAMASEPWTDAITHHELFHSLWWRLDDQERAALEGWGDLLRAKRCPAGVVDSSWWQSSEEAEARSYEVWATDGEPPHGLEPPRSVVRIFKLVATGKVGRR